jgi:uncharacterized glyoxalase superfamily protein PhnB
MWNARLRKQMTIGRHYLSPYINFQGRARETLDPRGRLALSTVNAHGEPGPAGPGDRITHSRLEVDGMTIIGSDGHRDSPAKVGDAMGIALEGTDKTG